MKKNYISPSIEIEQIDAEQELMLTVSMGSECGDGEAVTADAQKRIMDKDTDMSQWGNLW